MESKMAEKKPATKKLTSEQKAERKRLRAEKKRAKEHVKIEVVPEEEEIITSEELAKEQLNEVVKHSIQPVNISVESAKEVGELGNVAPYSAPGKMEMTEEFPEAVKNVGLEPFTEKLTSVENAPSFEDLYVSKEVAKPEPDVQNEDGSYTLPFKGKTPEKVIWGESGKEIQERVKKEKEIKSAKSGVEAVLDADNSLSLSQKEELKAELEETREERLKVIKENKFNEETVEKIIDDRKNKEQSEKTPEPAPTNIIEEFLPVSQNSSQNEPLTTPRANIKPAVSFAGPNAEVTIEKIKKTEEEKKNSPAAVQSPEDSLKIDKTIPTRKTDARGVIMMGGRIIKTN